MKLKTIEIKGFKSFGDKTQIQFNEGVTGIVGPNGCGKSNVVDAIRWVLGEQKTKALRSDKMENVIFNGTKNRKQANLAEVTLVFDNTKNIIPTAFTEIAITRKLYRSGESEYFINQVGCRLKDIYNLFLDTGIGSDSYAIMELKMIDEVLNDKEHSRRQLFEEASGVSKYKIRKKETLQRLQETQQDLERVEDILFEIGKNAKTLQTQAKKAEKFLQLKEAYKAVSLDVAYFELQNQLNVMEQLNKEQTTLNQHVIASEAQINTIDSQIQQVKLSLLEQEKLLASRQKATNNFQQEVRNYEQEKKYKNEQYKILLDKEHGFTQQILADKNHQIALSKQVEALEKTLRLEEINKENLAQKVFAFKEQADEQWQRLESKKIEERQLQKQQQAFQLQLHQLEKNAAVLRIQLESLAKDLERNKTEEIQKNEEFGGFSASIAQLEETNAQYKTQLTLLQKAEDFNNQQIIDAQKQLEQIKQALTEKYRQFDAKRNEFQLLKSLVESLEGFPESIKFLKKSANWAKQAQLLSDIIASDPAFKLAIENYLEPVLNYYVVETYEEAMQGISLLAKASKGKANFFVLEALTFHKHYAISWLPPFKPVLELVDVDKLYNNLLNYLLGNVYVLPEGTPMTDSDLINFQKQHANLIFLTQSSKVQLQQFSVGGGSIGLFEGKRLGRKRNLEQITKELSNLETNINADKATINAMQQQLLVFKEASKKNEIEQTKSKINQLQQQLIQVKTKQEQYDEFIKKNNHRVAELHLQNTRLTNELQTLMPQIHALQTQIDASSVALDALSEENKQLQTNQQFASQQYNQHNLSLHQLTNKLNNLNNDYQYKTNQINLLTKRIADFTHQLEEVKGGIVALASSTDFSDEHLLNMYEQLTAMQNAISETEQTYWDGKTQLTTLEDSLSVARRNKELNQQMVQTSIANLLEAKMNLKAYTDKLMLSFEIDASTLDNHRPDNHAVESDLIQQRDLLKNKIEQYGPVNPLAIEAYKEIAERESFIITQKSDLEEAKKSLMQTIAEIDTTAKAKFMDAFENIRNNFINVFRSLFTEEDSCDLTLSDPINPLDSNININAKPKGKKPLTINQLSGGEKTLTAIALLFGIYLFKPAPFCIFDEVDAPLDDTNIDKFNKIIKKFSQQSQFILVTHNKKTMETTDVIYGVTMLEQGVSKVVPVDLRKIFIS